LPAIFNLSAILKQNNNQLDSKLITAAYIGSGAPSSNDPKFERRPPGAPWPTFHKSNDAKLFIISILKALENLETFGSGLVGQSLITRKTGASGQF
jgi:hypothetical protein